MIEWLAVMALATGTDSSFLDRLYKNKQQRTLSCSGLQIAKQLDSKDGAVIVTEVVDSVLRFLPSHMLLERWRVN